MTLSEFDARRPTMACHSCGRGPLERYQWTGGEDDGRWAVVCRACGQLLEWLDQTPLEFV